MVHTRGDNIRHKHLMPKLFLSLGLFLAPLPAFAWGAEGHEIAAVIALRELAPAARGQVARLLGSPAALVHEASWADEIRDLRPETRNWHFVDIPLAAPAYDPRRDCPAQDCVVAQISRDLAILSDRKQPDARRAEALRFLIHFVADVHQPLHAEDNDDAGGNGVRMNLGGKRTTLHHVWDAEVVSVLGNDAVAIGNALDAAVTPAQRKAWLNGSPADWADQSHAVARVIYGQWAGPRLPRRALTAMAPVAQRQLTMAGLRLAWLLNRALG